MVHVTGTVHDVSDNPDRVERIIVRAVEPRMHGTTYISEESAPFPVVDGVLDFKVLPGPCVVAFLRNHGATTYEKLMVPDTANATFKECLEAGNLVEEGDKSALEKVVRQIQDELAKAAPLVEEVRTLSTEVRNDRTAVDGFTKAAKASASEAATSESNAKGHETAAGDYAAVATTAATEAVDAMDSVSDIIGANYATQEYVDNAVARTPRVLLHYGTDFPVLSDFPEAHENDVIERVSDESRWRVEKNNSLVRTVENFADLNINNRIMNRNGETAGNARISRHGRIVTLTLDFPVPEGGPAPGRVILHLPTSLWKGANVYWPPGYSGDTVPIYLSSGGLTYGIYGTSRQWVRRSATWVTSAAGAAVTEAELLSPPPEV